MSEIPRYWRQKDKLLSMSYPQVGETESHIFVEGPGNQISAIPKDSGKFYILSRLELQKQLSTIDSIPINGSNIIEQTSGNIYQAPDSPKLFTFS